MLQKIRSYQVTYHLGTIFNGENHQFPRPATFRNETIKSPSQAFRYDCRKTGRTRKKMVEGILLLAQAQIIIFVGNNLSFEGANNDNNVSFALLSCDALYNLNFWVPHVKSTGSCCGFPDCGPEIVSWSNPKQGFEEQNLCKRQHYEDNHQACVDGLLTIVILGAVYGCMKKSTETIPVVRPQPTFYGFATAPLINCQALSISTTAVVMFKKVASC